MQRSPRRRRWHFGMVGLSVLTGTVALALGAAPRAAGAAPWPVAGVEIIQPFASTSRYVYVGKGERWEDVQLLAPYQASSLAFMTVTLDGQLLGSQALSAQGQLQIELPPLSQGFHRLDFSFSQRNTLQAAQGTDGAVIDYCAGGIEAVVSLQDGAIMHRATRTQGYRLHQLPDVLFNPHAQYPHPHMGRVQLNRESGAELTALAQLASGWRAAAGVRWHDASLPEAANADFGVALEHVPQLAELAVISLQEQVVDGVGDEVAAEPDASGAGRDGQQGAANGAESAGGPTASPPRPWLRIQYRDDQGLRDAVHALLNPSYLAQLATGHATISEHVEPPRWAQPRTIRTLADLGLQDLRLDGGSLRVLQLPFPGVWQPTDLLQGQLVLNAQNGLLPGSKLTVWLDGALAGSVGFNQPASLSGARTVNFQASRLKSEPSFELRLESTLITNGDCLPRTRGALWVDAARSTLTLSHHLKSGVAGLSAALVPQPVLRIDAQPGSLDMAVALLQAASGMLLDGQPVPARIERDAEVAHTVSVEINPALYRQRLAVYSDKVYAPYGDNGVLLLQDEQRFHVVAESSGSVAPFLRHWPAVQAQLPDGAREVLLAQQGDVVVLSRYLASTPVTPAMRPETITLLGALVASALLLALVWWRWRARRQRREAAS